MSRLGGVFTKILSIRGGVKSLRRFAGNPINLTPMPLDLEEVRKSARMGPGPFLSSSGKILLVPAGKAGVRYLV
jgi:hypothetical protein